MIYAIDHIQLSIPPGEEETARGFYQDVLGFTEVPKPAALAGRGGLWLEQGCVRLHLGAEPDMRPLKKAHPALLAYDLAALIERCRERDVPVSFDVPLPGYERAHIMDPFGNRIELLQKQE